MGVAGLWDVLKPAAQNRSLTDLAIKEGFEANPDGKRGFRLGIDASIWFFHAEYGREGENPVLRTLFFRCATLMHTTFLPIFVFDGPKRPDVKRGKKINRTPHKLIPGMKQIVEAFGFEWRMAPGEAEAELAFLNRIGVIDGVLSDDVDNFLFGATTVIRNSSNTLSGNRAHPTLNAAGKDDGNHTRVFHIDDILEHPDVQLSRGGMILIGLMSGGDYQQGGLARCGVSTAHSLAKCGFGDSLYQAARTLDRDDLAGFLVTWRHEMRQELRTDSQKIIGRKLVALSKAIPEDFPDIDILLSYVNPITSESMGRESNNSKLTWSKEPNVAKIAETCEFYFEWGYKEAIIKRFRTVIWHSIVLRILRRAVLDLDAKVASARRMPPPLTPRKNKADRDGRTPCGTPSKMIAKHFSSLALDSPRKEHGSESDSEEDGEERLIVKVHSSRTHTSTDGLLEYRLEIAPKQLVRLAESGIKGIRVPEGPDEWASEKEDEEEGGPKKRGKGQPVDPESHLRVWMPACMVKLVEPDLVQEFEDKEEQKRLKKAKKGTRAAAAKDKPKEPKEKRPRKTTKKAAPPSPPLSDSEDMFVSPTIQKDGSDSYLPLSVPAGKASTSKVLTVNMPKSKPAESALQDEFFSSPVSTRTGIKDLTKKKVPQTSLVPDLKSFYSTVHHASTATTPKKAQGSSLGYTTLSNSIDMDTHLPTSSAAAMLRTKILEADISTSDAYDPALWSKEAFTRNPVCSSPSKRRASVNSTSQSESEPPARVHKSPRKQSSHASPRRARPVSPTPAARLPPKKQNGPVIEITDDSESDTRPILSNLRNLPPLLAARARAKAAANSNSTTSTLIFTNPRKKTQPTVSTSDIIDLT
ncbi:hypothetical protein HYPSUDRAFT_195818 [Hypholoma sublateritium FD-334 SS-4]|uniref:XPG-I domain-containing protein n=1 Tax=Hypholoma sublateritium (strain FD-334 SS-4) TaxID=945553 RepID=A0A0D2NXW1_HYPSF|nr:hypothetical protein HYPSUDRAFT_195818 [Hypholoma sublateritium FD-334 SS-4]